MDDFDDPMLERLLAGGAPLDVEVAYGRVTRRVRQVRRRRVMVAGTAACVVLFAGGAFALNRTDPGTPGLQPAATFNSVEGDSASTAVTESTVTDDSIDGDTATTADSVPAPDDTSPSGGTGQSTPTTSATGGTSTPTTTTGSTPTTAGTTPSSSTPTTTAAPQTATYGGVGGSVTVRLANGALSLQGTAATAGYSTEIKENRADRVEVIFTNGDHETRIRVDLVNGSMVPRVDEQ